VPTDKYYTFMDQTQIDTKFRLVAGDDLADVHARLIDAALVLNQPLETFFAYYPPTPPEGAAAQPPPFLTVEPATVTLGALKKAETEDALIVRLEECAGEAVTARIALDGGAPREIAFGPYALRSFKITRDGTWTEVNLLEEPITT
jgi:hypothetical protein